MTRIRRITMDDPLYAQECELRERVLLAPLGFDMDRYRREFGIEDQFEHFVATVDHPTGMKVIGCVTLLPGAPEEGTGKLAQMAVDPQRQGEGIGRKLVVAVESRAFGELRLGRLMCHARDDAIPFYARLGWAIDSEEFEEAGIPHRRMVMIPE